MLVCWCRNDGIDLAAEGELHGGFYGVPCDAPRTKNTVTVLIRIATAESPCSDSNPAVRRNFGDLIFGSNNCDIGVEWLRERPRCDLRADPSGIA